MKKLLVLAVAVALMSGISLSARAESGSGLEISGNLTTVTGYQRGLKNAVYGSEGILNDGLLAPAFGVDQFGFFVDQVEIDLAKSFGENIRIRADLDVTPHRGPAAIYVEQAYGTVNIPVGNGMELLVGRFNSNIGFDPIDRHEMSTISFSSVHRNLLPHNLTGARIAYDFSEATRFEFFVVNDLQDAAPVATSALPSGGFNLSYAWGSEGNKSWVKLSGVAGLEGTAGTGNRTNKGISMLGDLSARFAVSDAFAVGAEGVYRQDDTAGAGDDAQFIGGQLNAKYAFSDVWDGTLRYGFIWDLDGTPLAGGIPATSAINGAAGLGADGTQHSVTLATGYQITDGARFVLEGGIDISMPSGAAGTSFTPGVAGMFTYNF